MNILVESNQDCTQLRKYSQNLLFVRLYYWIYDS